MKCLSVVAGTMILAFLAGCSRSGPSEDVAVSVPAESTAAKPSFRRWAVICAEEVRQAGLGDLVTVELSKASDLELVERDQLEAVTREL